MTDQEIAAALLAARASHIGARGILVADEAQAYRVQALVAASLGPIGGWKVGAAFPTAAPNCAPMLAEAIWPSPHRLDGAQFTQREVESEICFRLGADLPASGSPYSREQVVAAISSCHPGIEILQSRLHDPGTADPLALLADFIQTGGYVVGAAIAGWENIDFANMQITQTIAGGPVREAVGNPAGDMLRLITWLANEGALWNGGLRAGQIVTCGSWTGKTKTGVEREVRAAFRQAEPVVLRFI